MSRIARLKPLFVVAGVVLMTLPLMLAAAASRLAEVPAINVDATAPPAPATAVGSPATLDGVIDDLPLFAEGLPGAEAGEALAAYQSATLLQPQGAADAVTASCDALMAAAPDAREVILDWCRVLVLEGGFFDDVKLAELSTQVMAALRGDPANGALVNNFAVSLYSFMMSASAAPDFETLEILHEDPQWGQLVRYLTDGLQIGAMTVFREGAATFPHEPSLALNLAFFTTMGTSAIVNNRDAVEIAAGAVERFPEVPTARALLATLVARSIPPGEAVVERALGALAPLREDVRHALSGDVLMAAAATTEPGAGFLARDYARRALDEYDAGIAVNADPSLLAGRAAALEYLGFRDDARAALTTALAARPESVEWQLRLARLDEADGEYAAMREGVAAAMARLSEGWDPKLSEMRWVRQVFSTAVDELNPPVGDSGYLGYSLGSDLPRATVVWLGGAGGFVTRLDIIPKLDDWRFDDRRVVDALPDQVALMTVDAHVLLGDSSGMQAAADAWLAGPAQTAPVFAANPFGLAGIMNNGVTRVRYVNGEDFTVDEDYSDGSGDFPSAVQIESENILRHAGEFERARAACERTADFDPERGFDRVRALQCAGETAYLAGDYRGSVPLLDEAYASATDIPPTCPDFPQLLEDDYRLRRGAASLAAGGRERASELFRMVAFAVEPGTTTVPPMPSAEELRAGRDGYVAEAAARQPWESEFCAEDHVLRRALAWGKLGEIALEADDLGTAEGAYDITAGVADSVHLVPEESTAITFLALPRVIADAVNNRGIARIRQAQPNDSTPPNCKGEGKSLCEAADADFAAALAVDPKNPVFLLNRGWTQRLLGQTQGAIAALTAAIREDPSLFPALNDLGVLRARAGDLDGAKAAFEAALNAEPDYDLTAWNLGVVEMKEGLAGLPWGQAHLARSIKVTPTFRKGNVAFKTDERVYRVQFGVEPVTQADWTFERNYTVAAAGLAGISVVAALSTVFWKIYGGKARKNLAKQWLASWQRFGTWAMQGRTLPDGVRRIFDGRNLLSAALLTVMPLTVATIWTSVRSVPEAPLNSAAIALFAGLLATVVHEAGHRSARAYFGTPAEVAPTSWAPGAPLSLALVPLNLNSGPFLGHSVRAVDEQSAFRIAFAGPLANVLYAGLLYLLFLWEPMPAFRVMTAVQLAVAGYTMLPFEPLDGTTLRKYRPGLVATLGTWIGIVSALMAAGVL